MLNAVKSNMSPIRMSCMLIGIILTILFSCNTTESEDLTESEDPTLADQIKGNFKGMLQSPGTAINDYEIIVTEVNDTRVSIAPAAGDTSATFAVNLTTETSGSVTIIVLKAPSDIIENNGTFTASTGQLSYTYHLGGNDDHNIEIFLGEKQ